MKAFRRIFLSDSQSIRVHNQRLSSNPSVDLAGFIANELRYIINTIASLNQTMCVLCFCWRFPLLDARDVAETHKRERLVAIGPDYDRNSLQSFPCTFVWVF